MELWFQLQDAETDAELGPKRRTLSEAQADRKTLARPEVAKIGRVGRSQSGSGGGEFHRESCDFGRRR